MNVIFDVAVLSVTWFDECSVSATSMWFLMGKGCVVDGECWLINSVIGSEPGSFVVEISMRRCYVELVLLPHIIDVDEGLEVFLECCTFAGQAAGGQDEFVSSRFRPFYAVKTRVLVKNDPWYIDVVG